MEPTGTGKAATSGDWRRDATLESTAIALLAGCVCVFPRAVPWVLAVLAVLYAIPARARARQVLAQSMTGPVAAATLALPALGLLSTLWSSSRRDSFEAAA